MYTTNYTFGWGAGLENPLIGAATVTHRPPPVCDPDSGQVRVMARRCETCVFHPGNRADLAPGRLRTLIAEAAAAQGHIVCHDTLPGTGSELPPAICRGFADHPQGSRSLALRLGLALGTLELVGEDPPRDG